MRSQTPLSATSTTSSRWPNSEPQVPRIAPSPTSQIWWLSRLGSDLPRPEPAKSQLELSSSTPSRAVTLPPQYHLRTASGHKSNLIVMHRDQEQPTPRRVQSASAAGPAVEDHGRVVTTN